MVDSWTWFSLNLRKIRVTKYIVPSLNFQHINPTPAVLLVK